MGTWCSEEEEFIDPYEELNIWLDRMGLQEYAQKFINNGYEDLLTVKMMSMKELKELKINKTGHKLKLWKHINALKTEKDKKDIEDRINDETRCEKKRKYETHEYHRVLEAPHNTDEGYEEPPYKKLKLSG
eukprot:465768_1